MAGFSSGERWAFVAALCYLVQGLLVRAVAPDVNVYVSAVLMATPAWILTGAVVFSTCRRQLLLPGRQFIGWRSIGIVSLGAALSFGLGNTLWVTAFRLGGVTVTTPATQTTALWGALLGIWILRERVTRAMWEGLLLFAGGLLLLGWGRSLAESPTDGWLWALFFGIVVAFCWSSLSVASRRVLLTGVDRFTVLFLAVTAGQLVLNLVLWAQGIPVWRLSVSADWLLLLFAGFINMGAQIAFTTALGLAPLANVNAVAASVMALSPLMGYWIFRDPLNVPMMMAAGLILLGGLRVQRGARHRSPGSASSTDHAINRCAKINPMDE